MCLCYGCECDHSPVQCECDYSPVQCGRDHSPVQCERDHSPVQCDVCALRLRAPRTTLSISVAVI